MFTPQDSENIKYKRVTSEDDVAETRNNLKETFALPISRTTNYIPLQPRQCCMQEGEKNCRICLEDEDPGTMIAPCRCKGSSKWVHRDCLDLWRFNEKDRAFSQCTECLFQYHFEETQHHDWRRMKFCLFVSRDFCFVTVAVQLLIAVLALLIMLLDKNKNLVDMFGAGCASDGEQLFWCQHELAVYYLCGLLSLLVLLGIFGSTVLCQNGCRIPDLETDDSDVRSPNRESLSQRDGVQQNSAAVERRTAFYRSHRRPRQARRCCEVCCDCLRCCDLCCMPCPYHSRGYYHYHATNNGADCYCPEHTHCGCPCPSHLCRGGCGGGDNGNDGQEIVLIILLVIIIILAVIGFAVGVFIGVIVGQRIVQRHMFLLQKMRLVEEFQVADLSAYELTAPCENEVITSPDEECPIATLVPVPPPAPLHPDDASHLRKLGLLE